MLRPSVALVCFVIVHAAFAKDLNTLIMSPSQYATVRAALPSAYDPNLSKILTSTETLWYDENVMQRSYQDSVGASSNDKWPNLVAGSEPVITGMHDRTRHRWQFPFATTAGTDDSTNLHVTNFVSFPQTQGKVPTISITTKIKNANRPEWMWTYPEGTVFGEVIFVKDGANLLPVEVRTRTRQVTNWSMNVYRPFPRASDLVKGIQRLRPDWALDINLRAMVRHLENNDNLVAASLKGAAKLAPTFEQSGYLDVLPDFNNDQLVRELLTTTKFRSAYDVSWKTNGTQRTFAASAKGNGLNIVPNNYTVGLIQVTDDSCMRCHQDTGRLVSEFYFDLYLYGELWGKDGIFSFHPYDERLYPKLRLEGFDNRALNPVLRDAGIFKTAF